MNLTQEVRDGILNHTGPDIPFTLEGRIVRAADRIAYVNHDADDAIRAGIIRPGDLPGRVLEQLGNSTSKRIDTLIRDIVESSDGFEGISQSEVCRDAMNELRSFLFDNVYFSEMVMRDARLYEIEKAIPALYYYYMKDPGKLPLEFQNLTDEYGTQEMVKDHIAGMTDRYAMNTYEAIN
jgi:dGTPase